MSSPFKRQPHKMAKHTQTIRQLLPVNCLSVTIFWGWHLKGKRYDSPISYCSKILKLKDRNQLSKYIQTVTKTLTYKSIINTSTYVMF